MRSEAGHCRPVFAISPASTRSTTGIDVHADSALAKATSTLDPIYEDFSEEYRATRLAPHPPRQRPFHPAWPALFPSLQPDPAANAAAAVPVFASTGTRLPDFFESEVVVRDEGPVADGASVSGTQTIPCDVLARAVYNGDMGLAVRVRRELEESGTPVLPRLVYVHAATQALRAGSEAGIAGAADHAAYDECLAWLRFVPRLTPARMSTAHGHALAAHLSALGIAALPHAADPSEHATRFIAALLLLAADKGVGVLAPLLAALLPALSTAAPARVSHTLLENLVAHAAAHAPADAPDPGRRWFAGAQFRALVRAWRNEHLKALFRAGRGADAREIFEAGLARSPPIVWSRGNKERMLRLLQGEDRGAARRARVHAVDGIGPDGVGAELGKLYAEQEATQEGPAASRDVLCVAHLVASQPLKDLVRVLDLLERTGRTTLRNRLQARFVPPPSQLGHAAASPAPSETGHTATDQSASFWHAAEITRMSAAGRHADALHVFAREFAWTGLPSHRALTLEAQRAVDSASAPCEVTPDMLELDVDADETAIDTPGALPPAVKLTPNTRVLAAVLPSAIASLRDPSAEAIARYHGNYIFLNRAAPASLQPDGVCHLAFIKAYAAHVTPIELESYVTRLDMQKVHVGHQSWSFVALALAKAHQISRLNRLLKRLGKFEVANQQQRNANSAQAAPQPDAPPKMLVPRSFLAPAIELLRRRETTQARSVLKEMNKRFAQS